jgi:hypothetical protein
MDLSDELDPSPLDRGDSNKSGSHIGPNIKRQKQAGQDGIFHRKLSWRGSFNSIVPFELGVCHAVSLARAAKTSQFKDKLGPITFRNGPYFPA